MKVGKKALSVLLALIMIMSSMSVSFSVLGATTATNDIYGAIVMHYDSLMSAIDKATKGDESKRDTSGIPVKDDDKWVVKRDTLNGGWLAVARAIASYAKGTVDRNKTYYMLVEDIKKYGTGKLNSDELKQFAADNGHKVDDYYTILEYFKFGSTAGSDASKPYFSTQETVTLNIGVGFDLLAFKDVASIEDKTYSTAVLKFTPKGDITTGYTLSTADDISFTTTDFVEAGTDVSVIKGVLEWCIGRNVNNMSFDGKDASDKDPDAEGRYTFAKWINLDALSVDQLADMTNLLALFDTTMAVAGFGYTEAQIWDHYVAPVVGKTYTETKVWYETAGARAEPESRVVAYSVELEGLMRTNISGMNAAEL